MTGPTEFTRGWPFKPVSKGASKISGDELARREAALRGTPLFAELPRRHVRAIARVTGTPAYEDGATIVAEGSTGSSLFVVLDGGAKVVRRGRTIARLGPGEFFGEISLLDPGPRTASVVADGPTRCLDLAGKDFREMLQGEPKLAVQIAAVLARRLRSAQPSGPAELVEGAHSLI
jgi:CRP/FNR family cyclic AMP-dependent transcriptional regulator